MTQIKNINTIRSILEPLNLHKEFINLPSDKLQALGHYKNLDNLMEKFSTINDDKNENKQFIQFFFELHEKMLETIAPYDNNLIISFIKQLKNLKTIKKLGGIETYNGISIMESQEITKIYMLLKANQKIQTLDTTFLYFIQKLQSLKDDRRLAFDQKNKIYQILPILYKYNENTLYNFFHFDKDQLYNLTRLNNLYKIIQSLYNNFEFTQENRIIDKFLMLDKAKLQDFEKLYSKIKPIIFTQDSDLMELFFNLDTRILYTLKLFPKLDQLINVIANPKEINNYIYLTEQKKEFLGYPFDEKCIIEAFLTLEKNQIRFLQNLAVDLIYKKKNENSYVDDEEKEHKKQLNTYSETRFILFAVENIYKNIDLSPRSNIKLSSKENITQAEACKQM